MTGIELPPRTEDFTADAVELFFDLAYVFAFSQLVGLIVHDPSWSGIASAAMLFLILWLPWQQLTWAANAVSGNGRPIRIIFLAATAISVPMAAATSTALTTGGREPQKDVPGTFVADSTDAAHTETCPSGDLAQLSSQQRRIGGDDGDDRTAFLWCEQSTYSTGSKPLSSTLSRSIFGQPLSRQQQRRPPL